MSERMSERTSEPSSITLLDLDAAGLDPTQPCPPDFMQFVYDNSQSGYLTLWSHILAEPDGASRIQHWLDEGLAAYHARTIQTQMAPAGSKPSGDHVTEVTYDGGGAVTPAAPVNRDVPAITGTGEVGQTLAVTMGNWDGEPTAYAYAWASDGIPNSATGDTYTIPPGDAGKSITCVVTATNAGGSTAAPPSNAIVVAAAGR